MKQAKKLSFNTMAIIQYYVEKKEAKNVILIYYYKNKTIKNIL